MPWLTSLYLALANGGLLALTALVVVVFAAVLFPRASRRYRHPADPTIIDLQLAFTKRRFAEVVATWMEHTGFQAAQRARDSLWQLDFVFPLAYALMGASALARLTAHPPAPPSRLALALFALPLLAALADLGENLCHLRLLRGVRSPDDLRRLPAGLIGLASTLAALKMLLIADAVQALLVVAALRLAGLNV
jgi:hypothetical protein